MQSNLVWSDRVRAARPATIHVSDFSAALRRSRRHRHRWFGAMLAAASAARLASMASAGTVGYYRFEEGDSNTVAGGIDSIVDSSGAGNPGTPDGTPTYRNEVPAALVPLSGAANTRSMEFDGSSKISFANTFQFHISGDATLEFWTRFESLAHQSLFWTRLDSNDANRYNIFNNYPSGRNFNFDPRVNTPGIFTPIPITANRWTHIAVVRHGNDQYSIYNNGVLFDSVVNNAPLPTAIGWTMSGRDGYRFTGFLDEVRISDAALTPAQFLNNTKSWTLDGNGNWSVAGNWLGPVPSGAGELAVFGQAITSDRTVTLDGPRTVGEVSFASSRRYTLGGSTLTLQSIAGSAFMTAALGAHTIAAPLQLPSPTQFNVIAGSTLGVENLRPTVEPITKVEGGNLEINRIVAPSLDIQGGAVRLTATPASIFNAITISAGARLDVGSSGFVLDYTGPTPAGAVRQQLAASQIMTSSLVPGAAVGYAEMSELGIASFLGVSGIDSTSVLVRMTRGGDADLSGTVDLDDFTRLAASFGTASIWSSGDSNYDGVTNLDDFTLLAANFGLSLPADAARSTVPEGSSTMLGCALLAGTLRQRRHRGQ